MTVSYCLVIGDTLGVSRNAMNRVVHRVSNAFCAMESCIIPNVGCEGSLYSVPHCMRRSQMN